MKKVRIGVFGAGRGQVMIDTAAQYPDAELVAVCDKYRPALDRCGRVAEAHGKNVTLYEQFDDFFNHDMDAVVLANYAHEHAPYAIRLMDSGRHVASEVLPTMTMAQAVALAEAVERSGRVYSYLENYCYFPATAEMRRIYRAGDLGEVKHAEGEYVHDCESIIPRITYGERSHWRNHIWSTYYCTHSLGPILHITGLRPVSVVGVECPPAERLRALGQARPEAAMEIVTLENGATVKSIHGNLIREPSSVWYCIYGSEGMAESNRWEGGTATINTYIPKQAKTKVAYQPAPAVDSELARGTHGHGGSDFYTMHYFIQKILGSPEGENSIDVYSALDMGMAGLLAHRSVIAGNAPVKIPDMRDRAQREAYRDDTFSWNDEPDITADIPDSVYDKVRSRWHEIESEREEQ